MSLSAASSETFGLGQYVQPSQITYLTATGSWDWNGPGTFLECSLCIEIEQSLQNSCLLRDDRRAVTDMCLSMFAAVVSP